MLAGYFLISNRLPPWREQWSRGKGPLTQTSEKGTVFIRNDISMRHISHPLAALAVTLSGALSWLILSTYRPVCTKRGLSLRFPNFECASWFSLNLLSILGIHWWTWDRPEDLVGAPFLSFIFGRRGKGRYRDQRFRDGM